MSLTSFLEIKDVKERFCQEFKIPKMTAKKQLLAPPLSNRYSLVGTAFDYLLRFYLEWLNPNALTRLWIADTALHPPTHEGVSVISFPLYFKDITDKTGKIISIIDDESIDKAEWIIKQAKDDYWEYLHSGRITHELIESALRLAQLDTICRVGRVIDKNWGTVYREDVDDLQALISIVEPQFFKSTCLCLLNPTFGEASVLVGGADADLVIDDMIIDIKTTKNFRLERRYFNQLIGYYVLHEIAGVDGPTTKSKIERVAIYFSRQAYLYTLNLQDFINIITFPSFINWFIHRAEYGAPCDRLGLPLGGGVA